MSDRRASSDRFSGLPGVWITNPYEEEDGKYRVPAKIVQASSEDRDVALTTALSPPLRVTMSLDSVLQQAVDVAASADASNLLDLHPINAATVEMNLTTRFLRDAVYTSLGDVLVAMNPYGPVVDSITGTSPFDHSALLFHYARAEMSSGEGESSPHIYSTAGCALLAARRDRADQSIILMGESGSGKTENWRHALRYVAYSAGLPSSDGRDVSHHSRALRRLITDADTVLQAFGNAVTLRNANSSRYGCSLTVGVDSNGALRAVSFTTSMLETARLTATPEGERLFRVFYAMRWGLPAAKAESLRLPAVFDEFVGLHAAEGHRANPEKEARAYTELIAALRSIGVDDGRQAEIWRLLVGILSLQNVQFRDEETCSVTNGDALASAAACLGVEEDALRGGLTTRLIKTQSSVSVAQLRASEAADTRDGAVRHLYRKLFEWLAAGVNAEGARLAGALPPGAPVASVTIVDMFGFAVHERNSFTELCENYSAERVLQQYLTSVFVLEERVCAAEGVGCAVVAFDDNVLVLDLIASKSNGILQAIDGACLFTRPDDKNIMLRLDALRRHQKYRKATPAECPDGGFVVVHSIGSVAYDVRGLMERNRNRMRDGIQTVLLAAKLALVRDALTGARGDGGLRGGEGEGASGFAGTTFRDELGRLLQACALTRQHFVLCINPNAAQKPRFVDCDALHAQCELLHVTRAAEIKGGGFPHRPLFADFYERYVLLEPRTLKRYGMVPETASALRAACAELGEALLATTRPPAGGGAEPRDAPHERLQIGRTRVLLKYELEAALEARRNAKMRKMDAAAVALQAQWRMFAAVQRFRAARRGFVRMQSCARGVTQRRAHARRLAAALRVKGSVMARHSRVRFAAQKAAAAVVKRALHSHQQRLKYTRLRVAALQLHALARGYLLRHELMHRDASVRRVQCLARRFLDKNRRYWRTIHGALLLQAAWRGYSSREYNRQVVEFLSAFRVRKAKEKFFRLAIATFKMRLARARFLQLRAAATTIQAAERRRASRWAFISAVSAALEIQRAARGLLARRAAGERRAYLSSADEAWALQGLRDAERGAVLAAASEAQAARFAPAPPASAALGTVRAIADVDVLCDVGEAYAGGWTAAYAGLARRLRARGADVTQFAIGSSHTVLLGSDGSVYTYGWNDRGQLGTGTKRRARTPTLVRHSFSPVPLRTLAPLLRPRVLAVSSGADHCVALTSTGHVFAWGANGHGQLGLGHAEGACVPTHVEMSRRVAHVATGAFHTVLLTTAGSVYICGAHAAMPSGGGGPPRSGAGQLAPRGVTLLAKTTIRSVACGWGHTVCLTHGGDIFAFGANGCGQVGDGTYRDVVADPTLLAPPSPSALSRGPLWDAARSLHTNDGGGGGGGDGGMHNRMGGGGGGGAGAPARLAAAYAPRQNARPHRFPRAYKFAAVACGSKHTVGVTPAGRVLAWGSGEYGALGHGDTNDRAWPELVCGGFEGEVVSAVVCGWRDTVALASSREVFAWGHAGVLAAARVRLQTGRPVDGSDPATYMNPLVFHTPTRLPLPYAEGLLVEDIAASGSMSASVLSVLYTPNRDAAALAGAVLRRLSEAAGGARGGGGTPRSGGGGDAPWAALSPAERLRELGVTSGALDAMAPEALEALAEAVHAAAPPRAHAQPPPPPPGSALVIAAAASPGREGRAPLPGPSRARDRDGGVATAAAPGRERGWNPTMRVGRAVGFFMAAGPGGESWALPPRGYDASEIQPPSRRSAMALALYPPSPPPPEHAQLLLSPAPALVGLRRPLERRAAGAGGSPPRDAAAAIAKSMALLGAPPTAARGVPSDSMLPRAAAPRSERPPRGAPRGASRTPSPPLPPRGGRNRPPVVERDSLGTRLFATQALLALASPLRHAAGGARGRQM